MIFLLRVHLVGELRASEYIAKSGHCDIRNLNIHSESWPAVKAALAASLYPNVCRYSTMSRSCVTRNDAKAQFHYTSTLLAHDQRQAEANVVNQVA